MALNPHAPISLPKDRSRIFSIHRPELLVAMDASTSQDATDPIVPARYPTISSDFNSATVSDQLRILTTQVDQLRRASE